MITPERATRAQAGELLGLTKEGVRTLVREGKLSETLETKGKVPVATIAIADIARLKAERDQEPRLARRIRHDSKARIDRENSAVGGGFFRSEGEISDEELRVYVRRALDAGEDLSRGYFYRLDERGETIPGPPITIDERVERIIDEIEGAFARDEVSSQQAQMLATLKTQNDAAEKAATFYALERQYKTNALTEEQLVRLCGRACSKVIGDAVKNGEIRRVEPPAGLLWERDWLYNREDAIAFRERVESAIQREAVLAMKAEESEEMRLVLSLLRAASGR